MAEESVKPQIGMFPELKDRFDGLKIRWDSRGGKGIFAERDFTKMETIGTFYPVSSCSNFDRQSSTGIDFMIWAADLATKYLSLEPKSKEKETMTEVFLNLHPRIINKDAVKEESEIKLLGTISSLFSQKMVKNSFILKKAKRGYLYFYPSFINHSCKPNCSLAILGEDGTAYLKCIRNIKSGEEITISYKLNNDKAKRLDYLKGRYHFQCDCGECATGTFNYLINQIEDCCYTCGKTGNLQVCTRCKAFTYCSQECQKKDWKLVHKRVCNKATH